jgi:hypothetical protein
MQRRQFLTLVWGRGQTVRRPRSWLTAATERWRDGHELPGGVTERDRGRCQGAAACGENGGVNDSGPRLARAERAAHLPIGVAHA